MAPDVYREERLAMPENFVPGRIGVVTVLYNSAPVLADFFASIEQQTCTDFVVYCVDNASKDDSVRQCRARGNPYIVIENGKNVGVAAGNNIGIRAAIADGCEYVLILNNDVVFGPELFEALRRGLADHSCSMTTPLIYYHDRPHVFWAAGGYFQPWAGYRVQHYGDGEPDRGQYARPRQVGYAPTCCVLVRRELFSTVGLMDERYFAYFDDTDFMLRARRQGEKLFCLPNTRLFHKVSSLTGNASPFTLHYTHRNHALFLHKNCSPLTAWLWSGIYRGYYFLLGLINAKKRPLTSQKIHSWGEGIEVAKAGQ